MITIGTGKNALSGRLIALIIAAVLPVFFAGCAKRKQKDNRVPVSLTTTPGKANVTMISHGKKLGTTPWNAKLPPGTYVFEFTKPGYQTTWRKITCGIDREDVEVRLKPISASVIIDSDPPGATLATKEGKTLGATPITLRDLPIGKHTYALSKPGFSPRQISFSIEDERPILVKIDLASNIGTVIARSTPPDANIYVDGDPRGKAPSTIELEQGSHIITMKLKGYEPYKEKVILSSGQTVRINAQLRMLPASLTVNTTPTNASLFVNGKQYNDTPTTVKDLLPGEYNIKVSKPKYDTATRTVTLDPGQKLTVNMTLDSNMGGIDLVIHPPGVTVYVDGKKIGVTQPGEAKGLSKVMEIRGLTSGIHTIMVAHKRAIPTQKTFKIRIKKGRITRPKPLTIWIKDTYMKLKNGREVRGRIAQQNSREVLFEPQPGIRMGYDKKDILILRPLKPEE